MYNINTDKSNLGGDMLPKFKLTLALLLAGGCGKEEKKDVKASAQLRSAALSSLAIET